MVLVCRNCRLAVEAVLLAALDTCGAQAELVVAADQFGGRKLSVKARDFPESDAAGE